MSLGFAGFGSVFLILSFPDSSFSSLGSSLATGAGSTTLIPELDASDAIESQKVHRLGNLTESKVPLRLGSLEAIPQVLSSAQVLHLVHICCTYQ